MDTFQSSYLLITIYAANARALNGKQASMEDTSVKRKISYVSITKVNFKRRAPPMKD